MKIILSIFSIVVLSACGTTKPTSLVDAASNSGDTCPTAPLKGFEGNFNGVLAAINFQGESQPLQNLLETHTVTSCSSFEADIHYSNPQTGKETREVRFSAQWDKTNGVFVIAGPVIQGVFRVIREGQFVVSFETNFAGSPAHCDEMITVIDKAQQLTRSVQCVAGGLGGASLGVRNALASRIP